MSTTRMSSEPATKLPTVEMVGTNLEVIFIPVSDVDRAKRFYEGLGWRLDADFANGENWRVVQFTPPGSQCSIQFGKGITTATAGSVKGLFLVVSDIKAARAELIARGAEVSEVFLVEGGLSLSGTRGAWRGRIRKAAPASLTRHSAIQTATAGSSRRSRHAFPDVDSVWTWRR